MWALPGSRIEQKDVDILATAKKELKEKTYGPQGCCGKALKNEIAKSLDHLPDLGENELTVGFQFFKKW